jgi:hypothetical protein
MTLQGLAAGAVSATLGANLGPLQLGSTASAGVLAALARSFGALGLVATALGAPVGITPAARILAVAAERRSLAVTAEIRTLRAP